MGHKITCAALECESMQWSTSVTTNKSNKVVHSFATVTYFFLHHVSVAIQSVSMRKDVCWTAPIRNRLLLNCFNSSSNYLLSMAWMFESNIIVQIILLTAIICCNGAQWSGIKWDGNAKVLLNIYLDFTMWPH